MGPRANPGAARITLSERSDFFGSMTKLASPGPGVLGLDIGGVIIDRANDARDTSFFGGRYLDATPVPGAIEAIAGRAAERFGRAVHLISKCGPRTEARTREWLRHNRLFERAGVPPGNLHFCRERRDKAPICARLGVTHFVDDRFSVLEHLTTVPHRYLFDPPPAEAALFRRAPSGIRRVADWAELTGIVLSPVTSPRLAQAPRLG